MIRWGFCLAAFLFTSCLSVVPDLTNVQLVSSAVSSTNGQNVVTFNIAADIRDAGQKAAT